MKRIIKIGFPIVCVAIIGGTFVLLNKTAERINKNKLVEEEVANEVVNETVYEPEDVSNNEVLNENITVPTPDSEEAKAQEVKNKAKAIEIVKKLAPPTSNVYYTNEGSENGYYIVAIRNNDTKIPNIIYSVDIENEQIQIYAK